MLETIAYTLPCVVCVLWALIFTFRKKNSSQRYYWIMLIVGIFYFLTYSLYISPGTDYVMMVHLDVACQPFALFLLALLLFYIESHIERPVIPSSLRYLLFVPPVLHLAFVSIVYYLLSFDEAAILTEAYDKAVMMGGDPFDIMPKMLTGKVHRLYMFFDVVLFSGIAAFYSFATLSMCVYSSIIHRESFKDIPRFFTHADFSGMVHLINMSVMCILISVGPLIAMGRSYIFNNPHIGMSMSFGISFFIFFGAYVEFVGEVYFRKSIIQRLREKHVADGRTLANPVPASNLMSEDDAISVPSQRDTADSVEEPVRETVNAENGEAPAEKEPADKAPATITPSPEPFVFNENIDRMFIQSMEVEKIYTDSSITIDLLAQRLKTNRSTLSALVNKKYGMTFKTMLATYRIAFAKQYMLDNPNVSVDEVAEVSGFGDRSSFFHKFKEVTGMSPKVWLTKQ